MYAATASVALVGGDVRRVEVEAHIGGPKDVLRLTGLPDTAVREAKDRVRSAVASAGLVFPRRTVTVNLAPADLPKGGSDYDLPIALCVLSAAREVPPVGNTVAVGELALDGTIRAGSNSFGAAALSARMNLPCLVSAETASLVAAVPGSKVIGVTSLAEAVASLRSGIETATLAVPDAVRPEKELPDLSEVRGQEMAVRAMTVAGAGGHHILLHGPPGAGKTMLARRLRGVLPPLTGDQALEVALMWAARGMHREFSRVPPFRAPHHTATRAALVGGGSGLPAPGEVSLANHGVLFLDELGEFPRGHLDTLRQPLEDGQITISRQAGSVTLPASFQLVAATNPCPCGFGAHKRRPCTCLPAAISRYQRRISGPLVDRFDLVIEVKAPSLDQLENSPTRSSGEIRDQIAGARVFQAKRRSLNRDLSGSSDFLMTAPALSLLRNAFRSGVLTLRGVDRVKRVARSVADLDDSKEVSEAHVSEALVLRGSFGTR